MSDTGTENWEEADSSTKEADNDGDWPTADQEDETLSPGGSSTQGEGSSSSKPAQSTQGAPVSGGEHKETMVFSLSRDNDLVTRYTSKRGKSRGRGQRSGGSSRVGELANPTTPTKARYAAPKPGSGGITVIEPLEKRLQKQQDQKQHQEKKNDSQSAGRSPSGGSPSARSSTAGATDSARGKNRPGSGHSPSSKKDGSGGGQTPTSKPKRYSSQRQKGS